MRIIKESRVAEFMRLHPLARKPLERWVRLTRHALWTRFSDVRSTFPDADEVPVASGHRAMVFNIAGNHFRLITAVHYMRAVTVPLRKKPEWTNGRVYVFYLLTHAEYDDQAWKENL